MATNYLSLRSSAAASLTAVNLTLSTLTGSTVSGSTITALSNANMKSISYSTLQGSSITTSTMTASTITTTNNVGIGTSVSSYLVDMYGSNPTLRIRTSAAAYTSGTATLLFDSITSLYPLAQIRAIDMGISPNVYRGDLVFYYQYNAAITEGMRLTNTGNLGVGTATPSAKLHIYDSSGTNVIRMQTSASDSAYIVSTYEYVFLSANYTSAGVRDNVGRGSAQIVLYQPTAGGIITFNTSPSIDTAVQERIRITSAGNVGIGITNPSQKLEVNGTVRATGYNLSGYNLLIPKMVYVGSQLLNGTFSGTTTASGVASFPVIIGAYDESIISGPFSIGVNPDTSQYFKAYYITCQITNQNSCSIGVAINNTVLASGITYSSSSFMIILQSGFFLKWTQFPTQGAYGYQGTGLNLQVYQSNTAVTNFQVNNITVHCVYLHTSYTDYAKISGLTYNSTYQQFT